jgi:hypothetical protein
LAGKPGWLADIGYYAVLREANRRPIISSKELVALLNKRPNFVAKKELEMPDKLLQFAETCDCADATARIADPDTWLDQALADSFPASDPLASHRFD